MHRQRSTRHEGQRRVDAGQIRGVARHDGRVLTTGQKDDARVHDVAHACLAAERAGPLRFFSIERLHLQEARAEQAREASLPAAVPPDLRDDAARNMDRGAMSQRELDKRADLPIVSLERDARPRIEH